jgi:peptidoglycan/LPS O-acetylase OafA/YrhL
VRLPHLPALDGLRGVAVIAVLLYHGSRALPGGALGVDLFFVLSGFLITTLLLRERAQRGRIDLAAFWARRARRLLPATMVLLIAVAVAAALASTADVAHAMRGDGLATLTYWANWRFIGAREGYFAAFREPSPLRHTWSLAIEEQWYLVWPPLVALALARWRRRAALVAIVAGIASSALVMVLVSGDHVRAYYGTDARAQALLIGALVAFVLHGRPAPSPAGMRRLAPVGAVAAVPVAVMLWRADPGDDRMFHGGYTVFAALGALVLVAATLPTGPVRAVLAVRPLVEIGRVSYGLYLWHWPVDLWLSPSRVGISGWPLFAVRTAVALAAAVLSFVVVESPIRERRSPLARPGFALAGAAVVALALIVGARRDTPELVAASAVTDTGRVVSGGGSDPFRVTVVGDSVGFTLANITPIRGAVIGGAALIGCGIDGADVIIEGRVTPKSSSEGQPCSDAGAVWAEAVAGADPDVVVVVMGAWEVLDRHVDGIGRLDVGTPAWREWTDASIERLARLLEDGAPSARIAFLEVPCYVEEQRDLGDPPPQRNDPARVAAVNDSLRRVVGHHPDRLAIVPLTAWLCDRGRAVSRDGVALRHDGVHFTMQSARLTWNEWLLPRLHRLVDR